ncbi:MAG: hypothetical protein IT167_14215 [Bryobacterales bacterium]|nr:hypothetical protein [Bryobacterales bacterium]
MILLALIAPAAPAQPRPGTVARYRLAGVIAPRASLVTAFTLSLGPREGERQWVSLAATKANGEEFRVWLLSMGEASRAGTDRYLFQEGRDGKPREYRNALSGRAVLPSQGDWEMLPTPALGFSGEVHYLGHRYSRESLEQQTPAPPPAADVVMLRPDLLMGPASNTKQKDETRRYDGSDYELVRLTREDYRRMRDAGITCVRVDAEQAPWADEFGLYYWGAGNRLPFPESLYRSQYLGPALFLDEPAVGTRDHAVRPRFARDEAFRKSITPKGMLEEFRKYYEHALREGTPRSLIKGLRARPDVDLGDLDFPQTNLYTWETMVSTAAYQLSRDPRVPDAMVFEPPGRIGTRRTLPEMDMTYGVQLPPDDPKALADIIFGFLRGAARLTGKQWGTSIYGAFERADAPWWLTHAYDMGATRFFFWDNYQLACVPFGEVLVLSRHLSDYARAHPRPDPGRPRMAAQTAILLPPGYDLGHVQTGKGNMWGVGELNLERKNAYGISYRTVMTNFFTEIERCFKLGVPYDLLWDLPGAPATGYREIVRIREDGKVEVREAENVTVLDHARTPPRISGAPPKLTLTLSSHAANGVTEVTARARVEETSAAVYYTYGADNEGIYRNAMVAWEVYGPEEQDQAVLVPEHLKPNVVMDKQGGTVEVRFSLRRPGAYRMRASTVDVSGRTTVVWKAITVGALP